MASGGDDEYEYVKGTYKYKKGLTPDQSRENPEAWRGTLRDGDRILSGQAEFIPGDDEYEDYSSPEPSYDYTATMRQQEISPVAQMIADVLAEFTVNMIRVGVAELRPHARRWWSESALPAIRSLKSASSRRPLKVDAIAQELAEAESERELVAEPMAVSCEAAVEVAEEARTMSSDEAKQRLLAAVLARAFSDEQVRLLLNARIEDADGSEGWATLDRATPAEVERQINLMLESNPNLRADLFTMFLGDQGKFPEAVEQRLRLPGAEG